MLKRYTLSLFLLVSFASMQSMTILHDIDTSLLGQPQHQVVVIEGNHRTVYSAYLKEAISSLERRKLLTQGAAALGTTGFLYTGFKAITNAMMHGLNYIKPSESATALSQRHVSAYIVLSALSCAAARFSWNAYDHVAKLYQRLMTHNTQDSLFASHIPNTNILENNQEIAALNAQNPNLIWVRSSHDAMPIASAPPYEPNAYQPLYPPMNPPQANIYVPMPTAPYIAPPRQTPLECAICMDTINKRDTAANMALPCGHVYHASCIRPVISRQNAKCPECNTSISQ